MNNFSSKPVLMIMQNFCFKLFYCYCSQLLFTAFVSNSFTIMPNFLSNLLFTYCVYKFCSQFVFTTFVCNSSLQLLFQLFFTSFVHNFSQNFFTTHVQEFFFTTFALNCFTDIVYNSCSQPLFTISFTTFAQHFLKTIVHNFCSQILFTAFIHNFVYHNKYSQHLYN